MLYYFVRKGICIKASLCNKDETCVFLSDGILSEAYFPECFEGRSWRECPVCQNQTTFGVEWSQEHQRSTYVCKQCSARII